MSYGVHYGAVGLNTPFREGLRMIQEAGADCVELVMKEGSPLPPDIDDASLLQLRSMAEDEGLRISGVTNACLWQYPLTASDPVQRQKGTESLRDQIRIAQIVGAKDLLIIPGYAGTSYIPSTEKVRYDVAQERSYQALSQVVGEAEKAGVRLCVENVWNRMLLSPLELAAFADRLHSSAAGLYFDMGNAMLYGDPELWISLLGKRIKAIHVKDAIRRLADVSAFVPLGKGEVPFSLVQKALRDIDYDGNFTLETHHPLRPEELRGEVQKMKEFLN